MSRFFIALDIVHVHSHAIYQWCQKSIAKPTHFKAIPSKNYHVTIAFLGSMTPQQQTQLATQANHLVHQTLTDKAKGGTDDKIITFDQLGWFKKPKVLYLSPSHCPSWLTALAQQINKIAQQLAISSDNRPYLPHISLYRKASHLLVAPDNFTFNIAIKSFSLYLSQPSIDGVSYTAVKTWKI